MDEEGIAMQGGGIDAIIAEFNTCAHFLALFFLYSIVRERAAPARHESSLESALGSVLLI